MNNCPSVSPSYNFASVSFVLRRALWNDRVGSEADSDNDPVGITLSRFPFDTTVDEPTAKTQLAYQLIFKTLKNLKVLEMRQPDLSKTNLGKRCITQTGQSRMLIASCSSRTCRDWQT